MQLSEQEIVRREKLVKLRELGINPYPAEEFKTTATVKEITSNFNTFEGKEVILAGRMMSRRIMGKASFAELKDASHLWGRMTREVEEEIMDELGDKATRVAQIGIAGENMVLYASVVNDLITTFLKS